MKMIIETCFKHVADNQLHYILLKKENYYQNNICPKYP